MSLRRLNRFRIGITALTLCLTGCVGAGMLTDGTSVSYGTHSRGALRNAAKLPFAGHGYRFPERWRKRNRNFGTDELVRLVKRSARRVNQRHRGVTLGVADLSPLGGGKTREHHSHRSGRDVDLIFYARDVQGRPYAPNAMLVYDGSGQSLPPKNAAGSASQPASQPSETTVANEQVRTFDVAANWSLIKALITDEEVPVQWIFIGRAVTKLLWRHARRLREPTYIMRRAQTVLHQPGDAGAHNDHMHVRVFCAPSDRHQGCRDRGPSRWLKKTLRYLDDPPPVLKSLGLNHVEIIDWKPHAPIVL